MRAVAVLLLVAAAVCGAAALKRTDALRVSAESSFTRAALRLKAGACTPKAVKCPDGSAPYSKVNRPGGYNGCGASGSWLNDKILGGKFTPCCNQHDLCYGAKGSAKNTCDTKFHNCMTGLCGSGASAVFCRTQAAAYYQAVSSFGCGAYESARITQGCLTGLKAVAPTTTAAAAPAASGRVPALEQALKLAAAAVAQEQGNSAAPVLKAAAPAYAGDIDPSKLCQ